MSNKKIIMYLIIIFLILFISIIGILITRNNKKNNSIEEYTPLEEITEEQLRKTNITLYFYDPINENLATEIRQIDSKELLENPEKILIEALINGPQNNNNLIKLFPENIKLLDSKIEKGILYLNFSDNIFDDDNLSEEKNILLKESIIKTLSQLNEINEIKILINGQ